MTQFNQQAFDYAKQFTDNAFKAQALMLKSFERAAELQLGALEQQSRSAAELFAAATELRSPDGLRGLWDKSVALSRTQAEQAAVLSRELAAVGRQTAESLGALAQVQPAANDATVQPSQAAGKVAK